MNYCPNCGNKLEPGHNFCSNCGQKPTQEKSQKVQRKTTGKRHSWVIPVVIGLLIVAISAIASGVVIGLNSGGNNNHYIPPIYPTSTYPPPTQTYQPSPTYTPITHTLMTDHTLFGPSYNYNSFTIQADKTISISWSADGYVQVYVLTQNQYDYFATWGWQFSPTCYGEGSSGTKSCPISNTDTYYLVINNPSVVTGVKVYSATASW